MRRLIRAAVPAPCPPAAHGPGFCPLSPTPDDVEVLNLLLPAVTGVGAQWEGWRCPDLWAFC